MTRAEAGRLGNQKAQASLTDYQQRRRKEAEKKVEGRECAFCRSPLPFEKRYNKYCSHVCSAKITNRGRAKRVFVCRCGKSLKTGYRFCSLRCFHQEEEDDRIEKWLSGVVAGGTWGGVCAYVRRWMVRTHGEKCSVCAWAEVHPVTGRVPVQVDHVDGNPTNHRPENLRFLCPNCHSLTATYGFSIKVTVGRKDMLV